MSALATQPVLEETRLEQAWFAFAMADIRELQSSGANVRGVGDFRVEDRAAARARMLLSQISVRDLPYPLVNVFSGGGISLTWNLSSRELNFSVLPDGQIHFIQEESGEVIKDDFLDQLSKANDLAIWLALR